ncbi:MAG: hypothetical protein ACKODX_06180 [Gemmata sp.]
MPTKKPVAPEQVEAAINALRTFWQTGRESWERVRATIPPAASTERSKKNKKKRKPDGYAHGSKLDTLHREAADIGISYDTLKKGWKAAQEYTEQQIGELCDMVAEHRARFGATHLIRLLAVKDRKRRDAMTRSAIRGRWGVTRLERAIQAINGRRGHVGKRPHIPDGNRELLNAVVALCEKWQRFCSEAKARLSDDMLAVVERATKAVAKVKQAADAELNPTGPATAKPGR